MRARFGRTLEGVEIDVVTLRSDAIEVRAMTFGATIVSIHTPDRHGVAADVVLGFDELGSYLTSSPYFGAVVGRCANRIAGAAFELGGRLYRLAANDGKNHLHGGVRGFDKCVWDVEEEEGDTSVVFSRVSPAGEEGYPGTLRVTVRYAVHGPTLSVDYTATTDAPTIVNLSQHTYFNLSGDRSVTVADHLLMISAAQFTPVDGELIPTGELRDAAGTPFDFRTPARIGDRIDAPDEQLRFGGGYDHNWVLDARGAHEVAAQLSDPVTGRTLAVTTTEPGLQFYSGNMLDGTLRGKGGLLYARRGGLCLETQRFPDAPHHPQFPSVRLDPQGTHRSRTTFTFGTVLEARSAGTWR
jgi:aldose 1-epimerase